MKILKFGGSSLINSESIHKVKSIIEKQGQNDKLLIVFSAFSNTTDQLQNVLQKAIVQDNTYKTELEKIKTFHYTITKELFKNTDHELNSILSGSFQELEAKLEEISLSNENNSVYASEIMGFGEILSSKIMHAFLVREDSQFIDSKEFIKVNEENGKAFVDFEKSYNLIEKLNHSSSKLFVAPGFIASDENNNLALLGRGGSDYSASIFAAGLNANELQIWTDVSGVYTSDPKMVRKAIEIPQLSYAEAMELSYFGAKVIYPPTLIPVIDKQIPVYVRNTFEPEKEGTLINQEVTLNGTVCKGISSIDEVSLLNIQGLGMVGKVGISSRLFSCLAQKNINVILISQGSSEQSICIVLQKEDALIAKSHLEEEFHKEINRKIIQNIELQENLSVLAVVGHGMKSHVGISGKAFSALGSNGINILAIAQGASELNISFVIEKKDEKKALNVLHEEFFLSKTKKLNLFIAGTGNVGGKLIEILNAQRNYLLKEKGIELKIRGLMNSRKMIFFDDHQHYSEDWMNQEFAERSNMIDFVKQMSELNLRNSVFVDNTASEAVSELYQNVLDRSISIVTCNKIAASSENRIYKSLKNTAKKKNCEFRFESNVGAGLPIINTIDNLISAGDKVEEIQAVLSGSMNFILNQFSEGARFKEAVMDAMKLGYTEPDPRIDLSGVDIARKILILARQSNYDLEMDEVEVNQFLPESIFKTDQVSDFLNQLNIVEEEMQEKRKVAMMKSKKLRIIASFKNAKAEVSLKEVGQDSPFYHIDGKDNIVSLKTKWYQDQPLVIKGAGAGAEVTASGVFSDIIQLVNL